jgi:hypothetical protein
MLSAAQRQQVTDLTNQLKSVFKGNLESRCLNAALAHVGSKNLSSDLLSRVEKVEIAVRQAALRQLAQFICRKINKGDRFQSQIINALYAKLDIKPEAAEPSTRKNAVNLSRQRDGSKYTGPVNSFNAPLELNCLNKLCIVKTYKGDFIQIRPTRVTATELSFQASKREKDMYGIWKTIDYEGKIPAVDFPITVYPSNELTHDLVNKILTNRNIRVFDPEKDIEIVNGRVTRGSLSYINRRSQYEIIAIKNKDNVNLGSGFVRGEVVGSHLRVEGGDGDFKLIISATGKPRSTKQMHLVIINKTSTTQLREQEITERTSSAIQDFASEKDHLLYLRRDSIKSSKIIDPSSFVENYKDNIFHAVFYDPDFPREEGGRCYNSLVKLVGYDESESRYMFKDSSGELLKSNNFFLQKPKSVDSYIRHSYLTDLQTSELITQNLVASIQQGAMVSSEASQFSSGKKYTVLCVSQKDGGTFIKPGLSYKGTSVDHINKESIVQFIRAIKGIPEATPIPVFQDSNGIDLKLDAVQGEYYIFEEVS